MPETDKEGQVMVTNHEFIETSDKVRDLCGLMSVQQLKDLLSLLEYDLQEKKNCEQGKP